MSLLLTVPPRLAIMARDASTALRFADHWFIERLDPTQRPAALIEIGEDSEPSGGAGIEFPIEQYAVVLVGQHYGQGQAMNKHEAEQEIRQITHDVLTYFRVRTQLQFSNVRALETATLPPLAGVEWARVARGRVAPTEGDDAYWTAVINVTVQTMATAVERLR